MNTRPDLTSFYDTKVKGQNRREAKTLYTWLDNVENEYTCNSG